MKKVEVKPQGLAGKINVPGDKSISHRAVMFASIAKGHTRIHNFLDSEDSLRTVEAFQSMGVKIEVNGQTVNVYSEGWEHLKEPKQSLDMGNSGTTTRLLSGILASLPFNSTLIGDESLSQRPMDRIIKPLESMGAIFQTKDNKLPMTIQGGDLTPINYELPVDSAQVKSAVLLAGLLSDGRTTVIENNPTRDHTERMLPLFGGRIEKDQKCISIMGKQELHSTSIEVPGDLSSASFWIAGATITPGSQLLIENVGLNPTRIGFINVLKRMGANIETEIKRYEGEEPIGNIYVQYSELSPTTVTKEEIATFIDEVPLLALVATQADGEMKIEHIEELKFKESNRILATIEALHSLGGYAEECSNGILIKGKRKLIGGNVHTYGDHRIAMMASIAALICNQTVTLSDASCVNISYPSFFDELYRIIK